MPPRRAGPHLCQFNFALHSLHFAAEIRDRSLLLDEVHDIRRTVFSELLREANNSTIKPRNRVIEPYHVKSLCLRRRVFVCDCMQTYPGNLLPQTQVPLAHLFAKLGVDGLHTCSLLLHTCYFRVNLFEKVLALGNLLLQLLLFDLKLFQPFLREDKISKWWILRLASSGKRDVFPRPLSPWFALADLERVEVVVGATDDNLQVEQFAHSLVHNLRETRVFNLQLLKVHLV